METLTLFKTNKKLFEENLIYVDNESGGESEKEWSDEARSEDECEVMETDEEEDDNTEEFGQMETDEEET